MSSDPPDMDSPPGGYLAATPTGNLIARTGRDLGYLVSAFFLSVAGFVVCLPVFVLGLSLSWAVIGLFVLVAAAGVAGGFARFHRSLLEHAGYAPLPRPRYPVGGTGLRGRLRRLAYGQSWRDLLHVLVAFVLSLVTFPLAISWLASAIGGLTYWYWSQFLPAGSEGLAQLLGYPGHLADVAFNTALGSLCLVTAPWLIHGLVSVHRGIARALLVDETSALRQQVSNLTVSRAAAGDAELQTLRRLERDLHDGPQQRLVRLGMDIAAAQRRVDSDPGEAQSMLGDALRQSQDALSEIRTLSRGIAPPILTEQGLSAAVTALAARGSVPTVVDVAPIEVTETALTAAYYVIAESLANMEKHSGATQCSVEVWQVGDTAVVTVSDDGVGGASIAKGHGLAGLVQRLSGVDGTLAVSSPAGGPTRVSATLPVVGR